MPPSATIYPQYYRSRPQIGLVLAFAGNLAIVAVFLWMALVIWPEALRSLRHIATFDFRVQDFWAAVVFGACVWIPFDVYGRYGWSLFPGAFAIHLLSKDELQIRRYFKVLKVARLSVASARFERVSFWTGKNFPAEDVLIYTADALPPRDIRFTVRYGKVEGKSASQPLQIPSLFPMTVFKAVMKWSQAT